MEHKDFNLIVFSADLTRHTITLCSELTTSNSGEYKAQGIIKCEINPMVESYVFEHILKPCVVTIYRNKVVSLRGL